MAKPVYRSVHRPPFPSDLRRLFRDLARIAVASTFTVAAAGCTRYDLNEEPIDPGIIHQPTAGDSSGQGGAGGTVGGVGGVAGDLAGEGGFAGFIPTGGFGGEAGATGGFAGMTGGVGGSPPPNPTGPWQNILCRPNGGPDLIDSMTLRQPIDFAALYNVQWTDSGPWVDEDGGVPQPESFLVEQILFGSACATSADHATCLRSLNALKPTESQCSNGDACRVLLTTNDDSLTRIEERAALVALLGSIDTAKEAALAAWLGGTDVACVSSTDLEPPLGTRVRTVEGGLEVQTRVDNCVEAYTRNELVLPDGTVKYLSETFDGQSCAVGRRPEGLLAVGPRVACNELGAYFASAAHLEAASVHAFARFAQELEVLGAPAAFVEDARRAAVEEIAHTEMVGSIAQRFGGELTAPQVQAPSARDAFAIAIENAVEGCVRETYGALVAWHQAQAALDPVVRQAMARIAEDETRHAELAWRVASWLEPQLSELQQCQVNTARNAAFATLRAELEVAGLSPTACALIGMPDETHSVALLDQLGSALSLQA